MKRGMLTAMLMMSTLGVNGSTYPFKTGSGMNPNYRRPEKKKQENRVFEKADCQTRKNEILK